MSEPWDYPPDLSKALAGLKALWDRQQNPLCAWRAVELCLSWRNDAGELTGPHQMPIWCLQYLAYSSAEIRKIACLDPSPTSTEEYQRAVSGALGFTAKGKNAFKNWFNDHMKLIEAALFDFYRSEGMSPSRIYKCIAEAHGIRPSDNGNESERRKRQDRVTKGRRILKAVANAQKTTR